MNSGPRLPAEKCMFTFWLRLTFHSHLHVRNRTEMKCIDFPRTEQNKQCKQCQGACVGEKVGHRRRDLRPKGTKMLISFEFEVDLQTTWSDQSGSGRNALNEPSDSC